MTKVIIIDDEPLARNIIREYLRKYEADILAECNDGFEGLKAIQEYNPDLIFLDIQMPKINGFEMLELVENPPPVIFATAFDEYAIRAFEQNTVDYLLKPYSQERFDRAMEKFMHASGAPRIQDVVDEASENPQQQNRIVVKDGSNIKIIPVHKVQYLEAADDYVKIVTADGQFLKKRTMSFYERSLADYHFVRVHRSYLVNTQLITRIDAYEKESHLLRLSTGAELPVSKSGYAKLKAALGI